MRTRQIGYKVAGVLLLLYALKIVVFGSGGDFLHYLNAADLLERGCMIYPIAPGEGAFYSYSPFFAWVLVPFSFLPYPLVYFGWLLANVWFTCRIFVRVSGFLNLNQLPNVQRQTLLGLTLLFSARFLLYNFDMVQMNLFLLWVCLESIWQIQRERFWAGALLLALGSVIKLLPLVLIPYLLYRNYKRATVYTLVSIVGLLALPILTLGTDRWTDLMQGWWAIINPTLPIYTTAEQDHAHNVHSLSSLIPPLVQAGPVDFHIKRNILSLSATQAELLLNLARLSLVLGTLAFLRTRPFVRVQKPEQVFWEVSYILLVVPLIFPHQQKYAFVFILPAVAVTLRAWLALPDGPQRRVVTVLLTLVFALTTLTTDLLVGRTLNNITQYLKLVTWGTLLLIVPLYLSNPAGMVSVNGLLRIRRRVAKAE